MWQFTRKSNCHALSDRLTAAAFAEITHVLKGHRRQSDRRKQAYAVTLAMFCLNVLPGQTLLRIGDADVHSLDALLAELRQLDTGDSTVVTLSRTDWVDGSKLTTTWTCPAICR